MLKLAGGTKDTLLLTIGGGILEARVHFPRLRLAHRESLARVEPVCGFHVVVFVQAIRPAPTRLGEVAAAAVIVYLPLRSAGHVLELDTETVGERYAGVGADVGIISVSAETTASTLPCLYIDGCGGPQECCEHTERRGEAGEKHICLGWRVGG